MTEPRQTRKTEEIFRNLVHDLRQPLGAIETCAYILQLKARDFSPAAAAQLQTIEAQVQEAARMLEQACAEMGRLKAQRTEVPNLAFTNSNTAGVT